jgi:threonine/homoserine/homoserine lactone efflux protein
MQYLVQGILLGLTLSYLPGPIFFGLLQIAIERGFRAAVSYASGIWVGDILFVFATYFGVSYLVALTQMDGFELYIAMIGGSILIASGLGTLLGRVPDIKEGQRFEEKTSKLGLFFRGFFFNLFNPGTIFFWLTVSSQLSANKPQPNQAFLFFGGMCGGLIFSDILKAYLAKQIKAKMTNRVLWLVKTGISLILIGIGIFLIVKAIWEK